MLKPINFVNANGQPVDIANQLTEARKKAWLDRSAGIPEKRKQTVKRGYAAPPGTGPEGMTCKQCAHKVQCGNPGGSKRFLKCKLREATWTNGEGTDILARSPACSKFEPIKAEG